eukprot:m.6367 g.6367  ORF g.6367 m.6367 type:complete len:54 (+) comp15692_c0_seq1:161-322(+)
MCAITHIENVSIPAVQTCLSPDCDYIDCGTGSRQIGDTSSSPKQQSMSLLIRQ